MPGLQGAGAGRRRTAEGGAGAARSDDRRQGRPRTTQRRWPRCARRGRGQRHRPGTACPTPIRRLPPNWRRCRRGWSKTPSEAQQVTSWLVTGVEELKRLSSLAGRLSDAAQRLVARRPQTRARSRSGWKAASRRSATASRGSPPAPRCSPRASPASPAAPKRSSQSLGEGYRRSYPLQAGLRRASVRILSTGGSLERRADRLRRRAPGLFDSGYFVLSALDGAAPPLRDRAAEGIDLEDSGQAATLLVFSRYALNSPGSIAFNKQLNDDAAALGREAGVDHRGRRRPGHPQRLQPRDPGADPARRRRDHARHLPRPDPDPPLAAAGGDRGRPQPGDGRRRLRHPHAPQRRPRQLAAGRPRLRRLGRARR